MPIAHIEPTHIKKGLQKLQLLPSLTYLITIPQFAKLFLDICKLFLQTQSRTRQCIEAQHHGSTDVCESAETKARPCNEVACRKCWILYKIQANFKAAKER